MRCIVASLTDEGNNELISELVNTKPGGDKSLEEDGNMCGWEDWVPDPVDADPCKQMSVLLLLCVVIAIMFLDEKCRQVFLIFFFFQKLVHKFDVSL